MSFAPLRRAEARLEVGWEVTCGEAVGWLYRQQLHGIKLGLETMQQLCVELGIHLPPAADTGGPEKAAMRPLFLHVAGTNGKGSACAMLDAIYRAAGFQTGLYTSPHLVTLRERIRLNGEMIPEEDVAAGLTRIRVVAEAMEQGPTFFEIVTALALEWFQARGAEVVILETGLGGRLDATNVVTPVVSVLMPIALDHEKFLGSTLEAIAREKCGIIKPGIPVVSAPQPPEAREVIRGCAGERRSELFESLEPLADELPLALPGTVQRENAATVCMAVKVAQEEEPFLAVADSALRAGLATVEWPGRFQRIGARHVLDGAHNPAAAAVLARTWREVFGDEKPALILGVMRDKNVRGVVSAIAPLAARILTVPVNNSRACSAEELEGEVRSCFPSADVQSCESLAEALRSVDTISERVLIAGSLFLVGEALVALGLASAGGERSEQ